MSGIVVCLTTLLVEASHCLKCLTFICVANVLFSAPPRRQTPVMEQSRVLLVDHLLRTCFNCCSLSCSCLLVCVCSLPTSWTKLPVLREWLFTVLRVFSTLALKPPAIGRTARYGSVPSPTWFCIGPFGGPDALFPTNQRQTGAWRGEGCCRRPDCCYAHA